MAHLERNPISMNVERQIVTAFIISDKFCKEMVPITKPRFFETSWVQKIVEWCMDHYRTFEESPKKHIQDIFGTKAALLDSDEEELIASFISSLSEELGTNHFNEEYYIKKAFEYYDKRNLELLSESLNDYTTTGRIDKAERALRDYKRVAKKTVTWVRASDYTMIDWELGDQGLFKYPGTLGQLIGPVRRGCLYAFLGPPKRGKTYWLLETALIASMCGLKVAMWSHEMSVKYLMERLYKRIVGQWLQGGDFMYPVFDCENNQTGLCESKFKTNRVQLLDEDGKVLQQHQGYSPCTYCLDHKIQGYRAASWFTRIVKPDLSKNQIISKIRAFGRFYGENLVMMDHPAFTANMVTMENDLDRLEYLEGFVPDIVVDDYVDIHAPEDTRVTGRDAVDQSWKACKRVASSRNLAYFTASQSNRQSIEQRTVKQIHAAEDIRKVAHVDAMISLNQTEDEKKKGIMRLGVVAQRHGEFIESRHVMVLQYLAHGQTNLGSTWS